MLSRPQVPPTRSVCLILIMVLALIAPTSFPGQHTAGADGKAPVKEFTISGPFQHQNLTVFLIHGDDRLKLDRLLTLQEALEQNKVVVHETGRVGELEVENVS